MIHIPLKKHLLGLLAGLFLPLLANAEPIVIDGKGEIVNDGSVGVSRNQALQDAERKALQQRGVIIQTYETNDFSSMQTTTSGSLGQSRILEEGREGDIYRIKALVDVKKKKACDSFGYRKKIAVTAFPALQAKHVSDLRDVRMAYPQELGRILEDGKQFLVRYATTKTIYDNPALAPEFNQNNDPGNFMRAAEIMDAQFVVAGVIRDMDYMVTNEHGPWNIFYEIFDIPPLKRNLRIDTYLYDGLSGVLLDQISGEDSVTGTDIYFESGVSITSEQFRRSAYGEVVQKMLQKQAGAITEKLHCMPLAERVVKITEGNIYMNAGTQSNVKVGDSFIVYHGVDAIPNQVYYGNRYLGAVEEPKATLTIKQVQPNFSIGYLDVPSYSINARDIIRSW